MSDHNAAPRHEGVEVPEVGHLVDGYDYRRVVAWAQGQPIPESPDPANPLAVMSVTIGGKPASVGSIGKETVDQELQNPFHIGSTEVRGQHIFIVEGSAAVQIYEYWSGYRFLKNLSPPVIPAQPEGEKPAHFALWEPSDYFKVHSVDGPEGKTWFVALEELPTAEAAA